MKTFDKLQLGDLFYSGYDHPRVRIYRKVRMEWTQNNAECINGYDGGAQFGPMAPVITVDTATVTHPTLPHPTEENPHDFDHSGLGIGGINNDQSSPVIPSARALERIQRMHDTDIVCRRCGASKNFDGAMFTTGGGDICDDCF